MRSDIAFVQQSLGELYNLFTQILAEIEIGRIDSFYLDKPNPYKIPEKGIFIKKDNRIEVYEFELFYLYLDLFDLISKIHKGYYEFENSYVIQYMNSCRDGVLKYIDYFLEFNGKLPIVYELFLKSPLLEGIKKDYTNKTVEFEGFNIYVS